jgi:nitrogen-specific signal transduction histidine kinase
MRTVNTYYTNKEELRFFLSKEGILSEDNILVQVFTGIPDKKYIKKLTDTVLSVVPNAKIIGSTTDGEIFDASVSVLRTVLSFSVFQNTSIQVSHIKYDDSPIKELSSRLVKKVSQDNMKFIISFADGLNTDGEKYLKGIADTFDDIVVAGGLSGDNAQFNEAFVFTHELIISKGAVAASFSGDIEVYRGFNFNWEPIGKELTITEVENNIVKTIDGVSAYDTYKYYLGEDVAKKLPAIGIEFPLILKRDDLNIARAVTGVCGDGSLKFAGDLNIGDKVRLGYGNSELILNSSFDIPNELLSFQPESVFIYSCMARRRFMNHLIEKELSPLNHISTISGFFTYGEFYTRKNGQFVLLNQSMTVLALRESKPVQNKKDQKIIEDDISNEDLDTISTKALFHLINITSKELDKINKNLSQSVQREKKIISQQRKRIEAQAKMAQMGDMISHISHQWRQPLSTISTAITSVQVQKELGILKDEYFERTTDTIVKNVNYLGDTIRVFRDFLKEDKIKKEISVQSVLKMGLDISSSIFKDHHIKIFDEIDYKQKQMVNLVPGELIQVIINILNNAKDAIVQNEIKGGFVKITSKNLKNNVVISICDNAGGIPENIIDNIFDLYFTTKDKTNGTGLGLHMCKEIIENYMEGKIGVQNIENGCCFYIEVPLI